jgi:hypothetical protein
MPGFLHPIPYSGCANWPFSLHFSPVCVSYILCEAATAAPHKREGQEWKDTEEGTSKDSMNRTPVLVDHALQGGGSYGAFTCWVLDQLLEEP